MWNLETLNGRWRLRESADADDVDHEPSLRALSRGDLRLVVPALVVAEATYFVGRRLGAAAEASFLRGLGTLDIEGPSAEDFIRMAGLVDQYADFPLGGTDASVIALAGRPRGPNRRTPHHPPLAPPQTPPG